MKEANYEECYEFVKSCKWSDILESKINSYITLNRVAFSSKSMNRLLDKFPLEPWQRTHIAMSAVLTQCKVEKLEIEEFTESNKSAWNSGK